MDRLRILYYSYAFVARHGGRLHSEAFLKESRLHPVVEEIMPFPKPEREFGITEREDGFLNNLKNNGFLKPFFFMRRNYLSLKRIIPVIEEFKPNILHIRVDSNFLIIEKLKQKFPHMVITTEVNASPFDENLENIAFKSRFEKIERRCLQISHANFFISNVLRMSIMKTPNFSRDYVVHNGVDSRFFTEKDNFLIKNKAKITFGYIGTIDYNKNLIKLIEAFEKVSYRYEKQVYLLIIGDGPHFEKLKEYIFNKKLEGKVECTGWVEHNYIPEYLKKIDIAIHHSAKPYMSPLKLFEYLAAGKAVIAPDIPSIKEVFGDTELIFVKKDLSDLAEKMLFLLKNEELRLELSSKAKEKVFNNFQWKNNAEKILEVMQQKVQEKSVTGEL